MDKVKKEKLQAKGWKVGSTQEFLGLSDEEARLIDTKISLIKMLKERRKSLGITQEELATRIHSSQSRVAKIEKGERDVSMDLILKSLYALNTDNKEIAERVAQV